jgi:two-component system, sensor histidine kinase PdtaS
MVRGHAQPLAQVLAGIRSGRPDTNRVELLLKAGCFYLLKPGNEQKDLDSAFFFFGPALALSKSLHTDRWINESLKWEGDCYLEGNQLAPGVACFQQVIDYYRRTRDIAGEARTWLRLAECIILLNETFCEEKLRCYGNARSIFLRTGDSVLAVECLKNIADVHLNQHKLDLAERELLQVAAEFRALHYAALYQTYDLLRGLYQVKGDLQKEVFFQIELLKSFESSPNFNKEVGKAEKIYYFENAAVTFLGAGMPDRSLSYARRAWALDEVRDEVDFRMNIATTIVRCLLAKDSVDQALSFLLDAIRKHPPETAKLKNTAFFGLGLCYAALKRYKAAERCYSNMLAITDSARRMGLAFFSPAYLFKEYVAFGNLYIALHQYVKAALLFKKIGSGHLEGISVFSRMGFEFSLSKVDSGMGNYLSAMRHFESYKRLNDSLYSAEKNRQIQELQIKYETSEKDKDIELQLNHVQLLTRQNQLQTVEAQKSKLLRNVMFGGLAALLLVVGVVWNRYRLKQRINRKLERKQAEILTKNQSLEKLLHENEWLLREVHHRVKNNLQVVMSLLNSQSAYLQDEKALNAVMESRHRVQAMSLIHQRLYQSSNVSVIPMQEYITELVYYLRDSFVSGERVYFDLQIEPINLDVLQAVPVGLILNEVITNIFKHAFPHTGNEMVIIRFCRSAGGETELFIADNGRGFPPGYDPAQSGTFGMLLIYGLVEDLDGRLQIDNINGTAYRIRFGRGWPHENGERWGTDLEPKAKLAGSIL